MHDGMHLDGNLRTQYVEFSQNGDAQYPLPRGDYFVRRRSGLVPHLFRCILDGQDKVLQVWLLSSLFVSTS